MEQHKPEVEKAKEIIRARGGDPGEFAFDVEYLPPDPDGGGMFTIQYAVTVTRAATGKSFAAIGGIGFDWVGSFDEELEAGHFE